MDDILVEWVPVTRYETRKVALEHLTKCSFFPCSSQHWEHEGSSQSVLQDSGERK